MSSTDIKLSDKIAKSGKKIFRAHLRECSFARFILTGEANDANAAIIHMYKNCRDLIESWKLALESMRDKADTTEDKEVINDIVRETLSLFKQKEVMFKEKFGSLTDSSLSHLMSRNFWLFSQFLMTQASTGSMVELLTIAYAMYWIKYEIRKLKYHPNFKPNKFYDFWCGYNVKYFMVRCKRMLDAKESSLSIDQQKNLIELFHKTMAYGHICFGRLSHKNGSKGFHINSS